MKYIFLLSLLPLFSNAQSLKQEKEPKLWVSIKGGIFNITNKVVNDEKSNSPVSFNDVKPSTQLELSFMFKVKNRHYLSIGMSRINYHYNSKYGPCGFVGPCFPGDIRIELNLVGWNINHDYLLLSAPKTKLFILNGFQTDFGNNKPFFSMGKNRSFGYRAELLFQQQFWKNFSITFSPFCSKSISKYHYPFDFKPFNYGLMLGISKSL